MATNAASVSARHRLRLPAGAARLSRDAGLLFVALALANGSNYVFHVVVSRALGPRDYGELSSLLAVLMVLSVPFGVVQTLMAKRAAALDDEECEDEAARLAAGATKAIVPVGVVGCVLLIAVSPLLAAFLQTSAGSAALLGPYTALSLAASVQLGVLQGRLRFTQLAAVSIAGVGLRLLTGIGLVVAGLGTFGALLGTVAAQAATLALALRLAGVRPSRWHAARPTLEPFRGEISGALLGLGSFWLLGELDILLARHYLTGRESGYYASAGLLGRSLLFVAGALSIVALPRFARGRERPVEALRWLRLTLALVAGIVAVAVVVLTVFRGSLVSLAFGGSYAPAAALLPMLAVGAALLALANVLVYFHIALGTRAYLFAFAAAALEVAAVALWHGSGLQIASAFAGASALVVGLQLQAARSTAWWPQAPLEYVREKPAAAGELALSVVLPCHNGGDALPAVVAAIQSELAALEASEIIVVSDGSTDRTVEIANGLEGGEVRVLHYGLRAGKGHALRVGLSEARGRYVAFMDSDGDIEPATLSSFVGVMELFEPDIVLGSKRHPLSEVQYPPLRRFLSWGYHKLGRVLFRVNVRDTQTGLKLIRRDVLEAVLPRMLEKRYAFDLELLVVARRLGYDRVFEAPIRLDYKFSSSIDVRAAMRILLDTLAIFYRRYILDTYNPGASRRASASRPRPGVQRRILFLNWRDIRNPDAGGAEVWAHEVARRWVAQGNEVTLLTSRFAGAPPLETIDGVRIRRVGRLQRGTFHLRVQLELARLRGYDAVIDGINTMPFLTPLWRHRLPSVVGLIYQLAGDVWDAELPRPLAAVGRWIEPKLLRLYASVPMVTISDSTLADLRGLGLEDVCVVHSGRDEPSSLETLEKEPVPTFLFVGRLAENKRPHHAVEAFRAIRRELPDAQLWIAGQGPLERRLRGSLPAGAELLGYVAREELYERMARAHCLLVPSVREGWGLVVIEAASVGTPAVGYDVAGIRDSIRDGETGLLAAAGDPERLGAQAARLVADTSGYEEMQARARAWAGRFTWDETAARMLQAVDASASRVPSERVVTRLLEAASAE